MTIGLVLATYAFYPEKLFDSVDGSGESVRWYIKHHGPASKIEDRIALRAAERGYDFVSFRENRGLSRSWNDGLAQAFAAGHDYAIILNDDLHFVDDGFRRFTAWIAAKADFTYASCFGLETGASPISGRVVDQHLACAAIGPRAIERIGYFDEMFVPAYFEDIDYMRRGALLGMPMQSCGEVLVHHERSSTVRSGPEVREEVTRGIELNRQRFVAKWGGEPGHETFHRPYNDPESPLKLTLSR